MNYLYLGKIVNTHGIKGEIRIISNFERKDLVFNPNFKIYIGDDKEEKVINTYRHHKNFEMITLKGINDINDVLKYKGLDVYIKRDDLKLDIERPLKLGFKTILLTDRDDILWYNKRDKK